VERDGKTGRDEDDDGGVKQEDGLLGMARPPRMAFEPRAELGRRYAELLPAPLLRNGGQDARPVDHARHAHERRRDQRRRTENEKGRRDHRRDRCNGG